MCPTYTHLLNATYPDINLHSDTIFLIIIKALIFLLQNFLISFVIDIYLFF